MRPMAIARLTLTIVATFLATELFLRGTEISLPPKSRVDADFGKRLSPGARFTYFSEGFCMGGVNEFGYIGPAYPPVRTPGVPRIALVGDSFVQGAYLFPRYHFRNVMAQRLEEHTGQPVEVLNFGLTAIDLRGMFLYYRQVAQRFSPDLVLLFVGEGDLNRRDRRGLGPDLLWSGDSLIVDNSFRNRREFRLRMALDQFSNSGVLGLMNRALQWYKSGDPARILFGKLAFRRPQRRAVADAGEATIGGPGADELRTVNRGILEELAREQREQERRFVLVCKSPVPETYERLFAEHGFEVLDVSETLADLRRSGVDPTYWPATGEHGHWNHQAQQAIGTYLADALAPQVKALVP